jgi:hypothetical protein
MVWVKTSDDFMLDERVQAVDCCADSALRAAYEVCNRTETDGVFHIDQLMTRWSPAKGNRRRLRKAIDDLIGVGLVHRLEHDEALQRHTMAVEKGHQFGLRPVKNRHYFEILDYLEDQPSAEEKRLKKQDVRDRKRRQREKEREGMSHVTSRPPDPDPDPELRINDHLIASKEREPTSTASPSTPSNVAADRHAGSKLRREYEDRWQQTYPAKRLPRWNADQLSHFDEIKRLASEEPEPTAILAAALPAFFTDESQRKFRHVPQGLLMHWNQYVGPVREQVRAEARECRIAEGDAEYERVKVQYEARAEAERQRKRQQRQSNGEAVPGNNLGTDPASLADLIGSQPKGDG